jgi:hypothetical protein
MQRVFAARYAQRAVCSSQKVYLSSFATTSKIFLPSVHTNTAWRYQRPAFMCSSSTAKDGEEGTASEEEDVVVETDEELQPQWTAMEHRVKLRRYVKRLFYSTA